MRNDHISTLKSLYLSLWDFLLIILHHLGSILSIFTVNCAAKATGCAQHLKHSAFEGLGVRTTTHRTGDSEHIFQDKLPSWEMCFTFLRSLGGSLRALINSAVADGTTSTVTLRFCTRSLHVTFMPFQSLVALHKSSPTDFGDNLWGPTLGARAGTGGTSPPGTRTMIVIIALGSAFAMVDLSDQRSPC